MIPSSSLVHLIWTRAVHTRSSQEIQYGLKLSGAIGTPVKSPVSLDEKVQHARYFAPLNGEIKPDTEQVRTLLKAGGWLRSVDERKGHH